MSDTLLQKHWYDGWFYARFIDTQESKIRRKIFSLIPDGSTVLDVGCGTGGFALKLSERSRSVTGVDVSEKMIRTARKRKEKAGAENVEFLCADATKLTDVLNQKFEYATMSFFLHELPPETRLKILQEVKQVADRILILDYHVPQPRSFWGSAVWLIEFFAGREHFRNFRNFLQLGGLNTLPEQVGLPVNYRRINRSKIFKVISVKSNT